MAPHRLTAGLGLKPQHYDEALRCTAPGLWWEVHPENYLADGGPRLAWVTIPRQSRGHSGCEPLKAAVRGR